jgi:hypothetical protein
MKITDTLGYGVHIPELKTADLWAERPTIRRKGVITINSLNAPHYPGA